MSRQVQHRPERDAARGRELAALRKENQQLKRQVARLQKQVDRLQAARPEAEDGQQPTLEISGSKTQLCSCGGTFGRITLPNGKVLVACKSCKTRAL